MAEKQSFGPVWNYWLDAWQRSVLTLDTLRRRGNIYREHSAETAPNVLDFEVELVRDGRTLPRPVNYALVRVIPPEGVAIDPRKRPFIVVDPRAGHGPGIGGMKQQSEIGVALAAGHACYFIGFLPEPVPGQTIEDVFTAEALFVREVASLHPEAEGKPVIVANCQAGWQTMMMAAAHPDAPGPLLLAGSPLSYWSGEHGKNPMRYTGGMLGGTWLTALAGDIGNGIFDGANLVANFESLDPANTLWDKPYNLYSKVDTEVDRFLDFETWWGSPILLNAREMQWIADNLFVGNKLATGGLRTSDGVQIDLRNIQSPIIVFCSWGDNITPPQQALGWITDLYGSEQEIVENGQTIVYTLHQTIGHLGIFVSGKVASKEHEELASCIDMIDLAPPGLYEAIISEVGEDTANIDLVSGRYLFTLKPRTIDDIKALGGNTPEDDAAFATVARVSEVNKRLYERFVGPAVRGASGPMIGDAARRLHPNRLRFAIFSDENPMMRMTADLAESARKARQPAAADNPFLVLEKAASSWISTSLETSGKIRDTMVEQLFFAVYGSPFLRALVGVDPDEVARDRRAARVLSAEANEKQRRAELEQSFDKGGAAEAAIRSLIYVRRAEGSVDERAFSLLKSFRETQPQAKLRTMAQIKDLFRTQYMLLRLDEERALGAVPHLLPDSEEQRRTILEGVRHMLSAQGGLTEEGEKRLARVEALFGAADGKPRAKEIGHAGA